MAGVVAMASVIEDFDTQSCKKICKDVDSPVVKTITNYFSPVAKPAEKPFSPPRSNNIMDYFNRKGLSPKNCALVPKQVKENGQVGKLTAPPAAPKELTPRRRKSSKAARKLVDPAEDSGCIVIDESEEDAGLCRIRGSGAAILPRRICSETSASNVTPDNKSADSDQHKKTPLVKRNRLNSIELSPSLPPKHKPKKEKTPSEKSKKRKKLEDKQPEQEVQDIEKSLDDTNVQVNVNDASQLNNSTITISFDDFVRSQDGSESNLSDEPESVDDNYQPPSTCVDKNLQPEENLHVSPRMVTVQAEVHSVSPKEKINAEKVAPIFTKEKISRSVQATPAQTEASLQTASKFKSNVVLQEEDVELCVLESSSTPKCSQAERKQFMAAFKQPSLDATKSKSSKSQGKPKQNGDKTTGATAKGSEEDPEIVVLDAETNVPEKSTEDKKKPTGKRQKKPIDKQDSPSTPAVSSGGNAEIINVDTDEKREEDAPLSAPSVPPVRRSRRAAVCKQTSPIPATESPPKRPCERDSLKDSPTEKRKSKRVYKAEILCPPDEVESPIRIRFRRVGPKNKETCADSTPATKSTKDKKTKQAKKLLDKAKAMRQSKKVPTKEMMLRRSSRTEASIKRSYCENEDSIICVENPQEPLPVVEKNKSKKALRSLYDVLGKAAPSTGSKPSQDKAPRKLPPVSIFDENSQDGSENSQDNEQFKARREFLKSGLPESFKKQIAKTTAAKEAYATASASLHPVVHIPQAPNDCKLWNLPWPQSAFVNHLKDIWFQVSHICTENMLFEGKTEPVLKALSEKVSGWRPEMSTGVREELMKEISASNPAVPVQKLMSLFLKKRAELIQQSATSELSSVSKAPRPELPTEATGGKRKRPEDEGDAKKAAKKHRGSRSGENVKTPPAGGAPVQRNARPRRGAKSAPKEEEVKSEPFQAAVQSEDCVIVLEDSPRPNPVKTDVLTEDTLWTEKYQPQHSSEVIGNAASVRRLHSWLQEWKRRADKEDKKKQKGQKHEDNSVDGDWESGDEDSRDADDMLCNTVLITGPTGVGKTAAVYACAQELGFKVFEVNSSSQRSGRLILSQLKEATQSHQVGSQGVNAHKPSFFNSHGTSSSTGRTGSSPRKINSPRRAVSSPRKPPRSPRSVKRGGLAPTALANFFKNSKPVNKEESKIVSKKKNPEVDGKKTSTKPPPDVFSRVGQDELGKKTATSLILFEEVDVIFDDDLGFLGAIKTFMTTTKRPVILTTSDPAFSAMFDGNFEEIIFEPPSVVDVATYLQLLCLAEDLRTELRDIEALLSLNSCDVRRAMLQLQFWTRSGGGRHAPAPLHGSVPIGEDNEMKDVLPICDTGCTESTLGLLNIATQRNIWEVLKNQEADCSALVTVSRRQGVDLLYSNMEALLPLPLTTLTVSCQPPLPAPEPPSENAACSQGLPSRTKLLYTEDGLSDDASPVKVSNRMKRGRRRYCPRQQGALQSDSDSEDSFLSINRQGVSKVKESVSRQPTKTTKKALSPEELKKSVPVSQCVRSFADFLDDLVFVDLLSKENCDVSDGSGAAAVKDGLTDDVRIDCGRTSGSFLESASEICAQVQRLSFSRCRTSVSDAWRQVQQLDPELREGAAAELVLPVASHNEGCSFTPRGSRHLQVEKQRREVMDDLERSGVFGSGGNRPAAALDYLPALRTICKSEKLKESGKVKRRFLHYLDGVHLGLQKSTLERLTGHFP